MTVAQWIMIIELGLKLWDALNDEKATETTKKVSIIDFLNGIIPMLDKKKASQITEVVGKDGENIPSILSLLSRFSK